MAYTPQAKRGAQPYKCADGPFRGRKLYLTGMPASTLVVRVGAWHGRYVQDGLAQLKWQPQLEAAE